MLEEKSVLSFNSLAMLQINDININTSQFVKSFKHDSIYYLFILLHPNLRTLAGVETCGSPAIMHETTCYQISQQYPRAGETYKYKYE